MESYIYGNTILQLLANDKYIDINIIINNIDEEKINKIYDNLKKNINYDRLELIENNIVIKNENFMIKIKIKKIENIRNYINNKKIEIFKMYYNIKTKEIFIKETALNMLL
jgi:hypothetical protein